MSRIRMFVTAVIGVAAVAAGAVALFAVPSGEAPPAVELGSVAVDGDLDGQPETMVEAMERVVREGVPGLTLTSAWTEADYSRINFTVMPDAPRITVDEAEARLAAATGHPVAVEFGTVVPFTG